MIYDSLISTHFKNLSCTDRKIVHKFLIDSNSYAKYNKSSLFRQCKAIDLVLGNNSIYQLSFENIFYTNSYIFDDSLDKTQNTNKKNIYLFIIYLCEHNLIKKNSLYRILDVTDIIFPANYMSTKCIISIIKMDTEYYEKYVMLKTNHSKAWLKTVLYYTLDETTFSDKKLYAILNKELEDFKYRKTNIAETSQMLEIRLLYHIICKIALEFGRYIDLSSLLYMDSYVKTLSFLLIKVIKILESCNFFLRPEVHQFTSILNADNYYFVISVMKQLVTSKDSSLWFMHNDNIPRYCNCSDCFKRNVIKDFSENVSVQWHYFTFFLQEFDNSLKNPSDKLSFFTYLEQIEYFKSFGTKFNIKKKEEFYLYVFTIINSFYTYYQIHYDSSVFEKYGFSTCLLNKPGIAHWLSRDFKIINYNQLEQIPSDDKWILCYKVSKSSSLIKCNVIDFSKCINTTFRKWCKIYFWRENLTIKSKIRYLYTFIKIFNYINSLKDGSTKSYFVTRFNRTDDVNLQEVRAYKAQLLVEYDNEQTQLNNLHCLRSILKFISNNKIHIFDKAVFLELNHIRHTSILSNSKPISKNELETISKAMKKLADKSKRYKLYYLIFYLLIETELRFTQICNLTVNCIQPTSKKNEYVLYSETKKSNQEKVDQPISLYTKKCIDEVINLTKEYRQLNTNDTLSKILFIFPAKKKGTFTMLYTRLYNSFLKNICNSLELKTTYTVANLRDTHMTMAEHFIIKQNLSDSELSILTSHSSSTTTIKHYSRPDIVEMLETTNGVIIGDVDIQGNILKKIPKNIEKKENLVSDECGYCSSKDCVIHSELSCMLCKDFVTTISRKPYFEEQIKLIDRLIQKKRLPHDKDDLINRKRLLLGYIEAIIELEQEENND